MNAGKANEKYLSTIVSDAKEIILKGIADHYGVSLEDIVEEVFDDDAEYLFEYMTDNDYRNRVYRGMTTLGLVE